MDLTHLLDALDLLKRTIEQAIAEERVYLAAQIQPDTVWFSYPSVGNHGVLERLSSTHRATKRPRKGLESSQNFPNSGSPFAAANEEATCTSVADPVLQLPTCGEASRFANGSAIPLARNAGGLSAPPSTSHLQEIDKGCEALVEQETAHEQTGAAHPGQNYGSATEPQRSLSKRMHDRESEGEPLDQKSPHYFSDAFITPPRSPASGLQSETSSQVSVPHPSRCTQKQECHSYVDDPNFQYYLDLAYRSDFRLPHEPGDCLDRTEVSQLLVPLMEETPLTTRLLRGLLYLIIPGPLYILEVNMADCLEYLSARAKCTENFAAIISRHNNNSPLIVLGDGLTQTLYTLASEIESLPLSNDMRLPFDSWKNVHVDVSNVLRSIILVTKSVSYSLKLLGHMTIMVCCRFILQRLALEIFYP